jgi:hypothetical protein
VARINEKLELDDEGLHLVARLGLIPGATLDVLAHDADGARVRTADGEHTVPAALADQILVVADVTGTAERIPA